MTLEHVDASDLIQPDTRSDAQKWLDAEMDKRWANEQGAEPFPILESIALEVIEENQRLRAQIGQAAVMQQKPLTDEQITAGAKALCKRSSEICGVNADDNWNLESEYFKDDARCVLEAAHNIGEKK